MEKDRLNHDVEIVIVEFEANLHAIKKLVTFNNVVPSSLKWNNVFTNI